MELSDVVVALALALAEADAASLTVVEAAAGSDGVGSGETNVVCCITTVVTLFELLAAAKEVDAAAVDDAAADEFEGVAKKVSKKFDSAAASLVLSFVPVIPLKKSDSDRFVVEDVAASCEEG